MPASTTLRPAKALSVSRPLWPLLSIGVLALSPLSVALAEASRIENSTLTLGAVCSGLMIPDTHLGENIAR